jgi:predicted chitinase
MFHKTRRWVACIASLLIPLAGLCAAPAPATTVMSAAAVTAAACSSQTWQYGVYYRLGDVVRYPNNGNYYKLVNVGGNGSDATDPTISTWYWQQTTCDSGGGSGGGNGGTTVTWQAGVFYRLGDVVKYPNNGSCYKLVNVGGNGSDGTDPTISTWYWQPTACGGTGGGGGGGGGNTGGSFIVSEAQFNQMFPNRNGLYTYAGLVNAMTGWPAFAKTGSDTIKRQEAAAFLANVAHESDNLRATREYNQANWPLYCDPNSGCAPGQQYYGRGPIQLSWNYNYRAAGQAIGVDLWSNPDLVATDSTIAWKTAVWYWMTGTGAAGVTPHNAMVNSWGFGVTINAINGGLECGGRRPDAVQTRINYYRTFTGIIGVDPGGNLGC